MYVHHTSYARIMEMKIESLEYQVEMIQENADTRTGQDEGVTPF
jgi:hypothetical protein